jgi:hypothetical protein
MQALGRSLTVGSLADISEELINTRGRIIYLVIYHFIGVTSLPS